MARQIKQDEEVTTTQEPAITTAPAAVNEPVHTNEPKLEAYVLSVLQSFPAYERLYVDKQGGVYTPDTPENLRCMATLYKNPYFIKP